MYGYICEWGSGECRGEAGGGQKGGAWGRTDAEGDMGVEDGGGLSN